MIALLQVFGIYLALALAAVYAIWRLIGRQGFVGLEDTDSRLAKHFRKPASPVSVPKATASGLRT
jgi:hypothetical protein